MVARDQPAVAYEMIYEFIHNRKLINKAANESTTPANV